MIVKVKRLREIVENIPLSADEFTVKLEGCDCYGEMGQDEDGAFFKADCNEQVVYLLRESDTKTLDAHRDAEDFKRRQRRLKGGI